MDIDRVASRKKQPEQTRQAILDAAGECFGRHGYAATGIGSIVEVSGLTKGALFHHYADKRELATAWVRDSLQPQMVQTWVDPLTDISSLQELSSFWVRACGELVDGDCCTAIVAMAAELAGRDEGLTATVDAVFQVWREGLEAMLERGQREGWVHPSIQPGTEAGILISMVAGFSIMQRCHPNTGLVDSVTAYLETLRPG